ncbi:MAG: hypothetical protein ACP5L5_05015 [Vulcanisaeta sp.]|uniref:hypothetical protein n=1 Tax=Vulcanisaeta sp. TaxID=2020871 RepID=UPI003D0B1474
MARRRVRELTQETLYYQLNWPIKLRELSIKLQDRSYKIAREAIRLYTNGLLSKDALMEIVRLSGIPLNKYVSPKKYLIYENNEETVEDNEDVIFNDFEEVNDNIKEVKEEYIGQGVIRRLMDYDR